ncbi:MAG: hypothetical protein JWM23_568 [Microbacteriaceae bacterium]|nr:hypothetical protein [Microbacteriaceae bacterium]
MNLPSNVGDRYLCFVVVKRGRGWSGAYGQTWSGPIWECVDCQYRIPEHCTGIDRQRLAKHHEHGHAPCERCGKKLLLRKDGTPRQHAHNLCDGKTPGHKIEREFVKNMTVREVA